MTRTLLLAAATSVASSAALAQDYYESTWEMAFEAGVISTTGNTETLSVQGKADVRQDLEKWQNEYIASVLFKEDAVPQEDGTSTKERTAERYFASAKSAYKLTQDHSNVFIYGSHTDDRFGAYEKYSTVSAGYGSRWLETQNMYLDGEIGPGYYRGERATEDGLTEIEKGFMVRGALEYRWDFSDNARFTQTLSVESGADNTRTMSDSAVSTRLTEALQMKAGISVFHNTDVAPDKEPTDTTTFLNLVYSI